MERFLGKKLAICLAPFLKRHKRLTSLLNAVASGSSPFGASNSSQLLLCHKLPARCIADPILAVETRPSRAFADPKLVESMGAFDTLRN